MKRLLTATLALWSMTTMAGLPPTTLSGEASATKNVTFNFKVPNNLATPVNGGTRNETGNTNLLANPSFEASTASTSHTLTSATAADDTTHKTDGLKGIAVTVTSTGGGIKQSSTTNATHLAGSQGAVKASVYTTGTDVHVCPLTNGSRPSDVTKYCALVPVSTTSVKMPEIIVPFIMDGTSNGYEIFSDSTTAFTVDEVSVGKSAPFQGVNGAKLEGEIRFLGAVNCAWQTTSTSFANFAADTDCNFPTTIGSSLAAVGTKIPAFTLSTKPGTYYFVVNGTFQSSDANVKYFRLSDGTSSTIAAGVSSLAGNASGSFSGRLTYTTSSTVTINIQAAANASGTAELDTRFANKEDLSIQVYYFPPESSIYSQQAYYPSITAQKATFSATGSTDFLVPLDTISSNDGSYSLSSNGVTIRRDGTYKITVKANIIGVNSDTSNLKIDVNGTKTSGQNNVAGTTADSVFFRDTFYKALKANDVVKFYINNTSTRTVNAAEMVIDLVDPTPTIVGSFAGIEKCANDYECTDTFSAYVSSADAVSNENLDWINGNCTNATTGRGTCTFNTNLKDGSSALSSTMNCTGYSENGWVFIISSSSTAITYEVRNSAGSAVDSSVNLICTKGANDYKPKTAKIATSIGVPTVPGITTTGTGNAIDTFTFSYGGATISTACSASPCTLYNQIGTAVSSVTWASTGNMTANFSKTYSKLNCGYTGIYSAIAQQSTFSCSSCSTLPFQTLNGAGSLVNSAGTIMCQGSY